MWNLDAKREESGFIIEIKDRNIDAKDLAVLVSVTDDVEAAYTATFVNPIPFRGITRISKPGSIKHELSSAGQTVDVAQKNC